MAGPQARLGLTPRAPTSRWREGVRFLHQRSPGGFRGAADRRNCWHGRFLPIRCGATTCADTDGAAAVVLVADKIAPENCAKSGVDHRNRTSYRVSALGRADITESPSTKLAIKIATGGQYRLIDVAEIRGPFTTSVLIAGGHQIPGKTKVINRGPRLPTHACRRP